MSNKNLMYALPQWLLIVVIAGITLTGTTGCKSKKKLAREQAAAEYAAGVDQAKKDLTAILNDQSSWNLDEKEQRFNTIKSWGLQDEEVQNLIPLVADKLMRERAEAARQAEEERLKKLEEEQQKERTGSYQVIENYFKAIASASDLAEANTMINQALQLFATSDVPVLIIISQDGGFNDYDRPTTIRRYLEQLKDTKTHNKRIEQVKYDASGKITEIELIK